MAWRHYVAIGDSLTAGTGDSFDGIEHLSWADRLAQALAPLRPDFMYRNLAVRGKTTAEIAAEQLPAALALQPDLVSILAGGNDLKAPDWTPEQFRRNLTALVEPLKAAGSTVFIVAMIDNFEAQTGAMREMLRPLYAGLRVVNRVIRDVARQYDLLLVDLERVADLHDRAIISRDGIHANSLGYLRIAAETARQLSAQTGVRLAHPALNMPETLPQKHRVFREMLHQLDRPAHDAP